MVGAREVVSWLKTLAALLEDPGLISSIHMASHTVTPVPGD